MTLFFLLACADPAPRTVEAVDCAAAPRVTWETWGEGFFLTWCGSCHAAGAQDRNDAPPTVHLDSRAEVAGQLERVRTRVLVDRDMPVGGGLAEDDLHLLDVMLSCDF